MVLAIATIPQGARVETAQSAATVLDTKAVAAPKAYGSERGAPNFRAS